MRQATIDRVDHAITAAAVMLAHVVLIWGIAQILAHYSGANTLAAEEPVIATLLQRPRNLSLGPAPVHVTTEDVLRLQRFAPKVPEIPVEEPEPAVAEILPQPATAPQAHPAETGLAGTDDSSSGPSGGGIALALVQRVVPKYPARSAELHEEGATRVHIHVDESGQVVGAEVAHSSGYTRLDKAALDAVRKWKFARLPAGTAPDGAWVATEVRFILYRFGYSRLGEDAMDAVYVEEVKNGARDEQTPGSQEALTRFIADVMAGTLAHDASHAIRAEVQELRAALKEWGKVESIRFTGTAGGPRWILDEIALKSRAAYIRPTIEVQWNRFEVRHEHATSEWLIAVDHEGTVWNARASRAPWFQEP